MKQFKDLVFNPADMGIQALIEFKNGYGASVVKSQFSYGGSMGLYELAVLDKDGHIIYDTHITHDVLGYLNEDDVTDALVAIQRL